MNKTKLLQKKCPYCDKVIESIYENQLDYNLKAHMISCKKKTDFQKSMKVRIEEVKKTKQTKSEKKEVIHNG